MIACETNWATFCPSSSRVVDGVEDSANHYKREHRFDFPSSAHHPQASRHHSLTMEPRKRYINHYNSGMRQSFTSPQLAHGKQLPRPFRSPAYRGRVRAL